MTYFETKFFAKFKFTPEQIQRYLNNALRDFNIASDDDHLEVKFSYCYNAFIKAGIALIAAKGNAKVRSMPGHHIRIIEKMADLLGDEGVAIIGNAMRTKRNEDFYGGGIFVSEKEAFEYLKYVDNLLKKIQEALKHP
jgi:hypothetical protein